MKLPVYCPSCGTQSEYFENGHGRSVLVAHCAQCQKDWLVRFKLKTDVASVTIEMTLDRYAGRCSCCGS